MQYHDEKKKKTWNQVANNFNSLSPSALYRPVSSLKKAYENVKKNTRKDVADEKASIKCTGGGKGSFNNDPLLHLALEVINPKTVYGHNNPFDSDGQQSTDRSVTEDNCKNNLIHENSEENFIETTQSTKETFIIQVENDDECHTDINWSDYTVENIRQPLNPKLIPKNNNNQTETDEQFSSTPRKQSINSNSNKLSWSSGRRPITSSLPSSDIGKKYKELALKIQLVKHELENFETQAKVKEDRDKAEYQLKKKCLELDIKIKQAVLEKITSSFNPLDFLSYQK